LADAAADLPTSDAPDARTKVREFRACSIQVFAAGKSGLANSESDLQRGMD
jgi:hypothetical protein